MQMLSCYWSSDRQTVSFYFPVCFAVLGDRILMGWTPKLAIHVETATAFPKSVVAIFFRLQFRRSKGSPGPNQLTMFVRQRLPRVPAKVMHRI